MNFNILLNFPMYIMLSLSLFSRAESIIATYILGRFVTRDDGDIEIKKITGSRSAKILSISCPTFMYKYTTTSSRRFFD